MFPVPDPKSAFCCCEITMQFYDILITFPFQH
jgi:hypothetical protein